MRGSAGTAGIVFWSCTRDFLGKPAVKRTHELMNRCMRSLPSLGIDHSIIRHCGRLKCGAASTAASSSAASSEDSSSATAVTSSKGRFSPRFEEAVPLRCIFASNCRSSLLTMASHHMTSKHFAAFFLLRWLCRGNRALCVQPSMPPMCLCSNRRVTCASLCP